MTIDPQTLLITGLMVGTASAYFASRRGRNPYAWFAVGMFFGLVGMAFLFFLPRCDTIEEQQQEEVVREPEAAPENPLTVSHRLAEWFYLDSGRQQQGPVTLRALTDEWKKGAVQSTSLVWCAGMDNWKRVAEIPLLAESLESDE